MLIFGNYILILEQKKTTPTPDKILGANQTLTPKQLEMMRKRNEKYKAKKQ
ncbi:hypothetical protein M1146_00200 [Patescibacteria group bacterium]|nr:hypothetical protein [Patescibacteria group bacterium]